MPTKLSVILSHCQVSRWCSWERRFDSSDTRRGILAGLDWWSSEEHSACQYVGVKWWKRLRSILVSMYETGFIMRVSLHAERPPADSIYASNPRLNPSHEWFCSSGCVSSHSSLNKWTWQWRVLNLYSHTEEGAELKVRLLFLVNVSFPFSEGVFVPAVILFL